MFGLDTILAKMMLIDLSSKEVLEPMYNPKEWEETFGAEWSKRKIPGLSHEHKMFSNTKDRTIKFNLYYTSHLQGEAAQLDLERARNFLIALTFPVGSVGLLRNAGAPRVLFVWPNVATCQCTLDNVTFKHAHFNRKLQVTRMNADVQISEISDFSRTSQEVRRTGANSHLRVKGGEPGR